MNACAIVMAPISTFIPINVSIIGIVPALNISPGVPNGKKFLIGGSDNITGIITITNMNSSMIISQKAICL